MCLCVSGRVGTCVHVLRVNIVCASVYVDMYMGVCVGLCVHLYFSPESAFTTEVNP